MEEEPAGRRARVDALVQDHEVDPERLQLVEAEIRAPQSPGLRPDACARLAEIEADLAALRRVGDRTGRSVAALVAELEAEREALAAPPRTPTLVALDALRPVIEARVREVQRVLTGAPEAGKRPLHGLLGDRRMWVHRDDERGFRVEGVFELTLDAAGAPDHRPPGSCFTGSGGSLRAERIAPGAARRRPVGGVTGPAHPSGDAPGGKGTDDLHSFTVCGA